MKILKLSLFLVICLSFSYKAYSYCYTCTNDSLIPQKDTLKILYFFENDFQGLNLLQYSKFTDTSLTKIHNYILRFSDNNFNATFSNNGLPYKKLKFVMNPVIGYNDLIPFYGNYFFTPLNIKYFNASCGFTDAFYYMGSKREQFLDLLHTQNITKRLNIAVNYRLIYSPGQYLRQKSDNAFFSFSTNYISQKRNYVLLGNYFFNRMKVQENGGIKYDSVFTENSETNRQLMEVNLLSAENRIKESGFYIKQFFIPSFNKSYSKHDSTNIKKTRINFGRIYHSVLFKNQSLVYTDEKPLSEFYANVFIDSTYTKDSIHVQKIENTIGFSNVSYKNDSPGILFDFYAKHQFTKAYLNINDTVFKSLLIGAKCKTASYKGFSIVGNIDKIVSGYGEDNVILTSVLSKFIRHDSIPDYIKTRFLFNHSVETPRLFDTHYYSNNFMWDYTFSSIKTTQIGFDIFRKNIGLSLLYWNVGGYIYYDIYARPKQTLNKLEIIQASLIANLKSGNWCFNNNVVLQNFIGPEVIRLPKMCSFHSIYYERFLFNKAMLIQTGADLTFYSGYMVDGYMPAIRQFYIQNEFKTKEYLYADFFLNAKIKRARIFFKIEHLNAGLMGYSYYRIFNNPAQDRVMRFGLSWQFFD